MYPLNVTEAYSIISNHAKVVKPKHKSRISKREKESKSESEIDMAFLQKGADYRICVDCDYKVNYKGSTEYTKSKWPKNETQLLIFANVNSAIDSDFEWTMVNIIYTMEKHSINNPTHIQKIFLEHGKLSPFSILSDINSTIDMCKYARLLTNIRIVKNGGTMKYYTNRGCHHTNQIEDVPRYDTVWYNPTSLVNILSLARVSHVFRAIVDTETE